MDSAELRTQLEIVQAELKKIETQLIKLTVLNEHLYEERTNNSVRIDKLEEEVTTAKGAVALLKWIMSILGTSVVAFYVYIISNDFEHTQRLSEQSEKIAVIQSRMDNYGGR